MANMNFGVNILPKANNTYTLGNSDYKWNIFANTLNGISLTNIITDIQVDGTSIISNNIATLPVASTNSYGITKIGGGLYTDSNGVLHVNSATSTQIKGEVSNYAPIVPAKQHESVFYGLAKAAGDSTQSASSNAVGTYTDSAKTAIQNMLAVAPTANPVFTNSISLGRYYNNAEPSHEANTIGIHSIAVGHNIAATGDESQAFGWVTYATGWASHAEGKQTTAHGNMSHTEGVYTRTENDAWASHAEGSDTIANTACVHVGGQYNSITDLSLAPTWTANTSYVVGDIVKHEETSDDETYNFVYRCITANNDATFDYEKWITWEDVGDFAEIIGNGGYINDDPWTELRSNARALDWQGNEYLNGDLYVHCNANSTGGTKVATVAEVQKKIDLISETTDNIPAVFESAVGGIPLKTVTISQPITQSGSGTPYAPGCGKNKFYATAQNKYFFGNNEPIIIDDNSYSWEANTSTNGGFIIPCKSNTQYTYKIKYTNTQGGLYLRVWWSDNTTFTNDDTHRVVNNAYDVSSEATFTTPAEATYLLVGTYIYSTAAESGGTITEIQLEEGATATTYAPYSNIRPITSINNVSFIQTGKNILPAVSYTKTENGIKFVYNSNGSLKITGTSNGNPTWLDIPSSAYFKLFPGTYTLSGNTYGYESRGIRFYLVDSNGETTCNDLGSGSTITITSTLTNCRLQVVVWVNSGTELNTTLYPQLECGLTPTAFEPPLSQKRTYQIKFPTFGKNLFDKSTGIQLQTNNIRVARNSGYGVPFHMKAGVTYYIYSNSSTSPDEMSVQTPYTGSSLKTSYTTQYMTYTPTEDTEVGINMYWVNGRPEDATDIMIETDEKTSYEPFNNTLYGGTVDITNGTIQIEWEYQSGKWGDIKEGNASGTTGFYQGTLTFQHDVKSATSTYLDTDKLFCNICDRIQWEGIAYTPEHMYIPTSNTKIVRIIGNFDDDQVIEVLAQLATPITIQFDPVEILTLKGINTIQTDATAMVIENYMDFSSFKDYIDKKNINDIQINGTSIINNNIANIPIADATTYGVAIMASDAVVKAAIDYRSFITPSRINRAVFYGLAKAAGDTTQSASSNAVGTYTADAKSAIQSMLSVAPTANPIFSDSISMGRKSNTTIGSSSVAIGNNVEASGMYSHAEGGSTTVSGNFSHAEGLSTKVTTTYAHAEGYATTASGVGSHAEGDHAETIGGYTHAEGYYTIARGKYSHVSGKYNVPDEYPTTAYDSIWESNHAYVIDDVVLYQSSTGDRIYKCNYAHTSGTELDTRFWDSISDNINYVEIVGNGTATNARSNARALGWDGNEYLKGDLYVGCNADSTGGTKVATISQLPSIMAGATSSAAGTSGLVPAPATTDVNKFLAGDGTYKSGGLPMVILSYGSSTWNDFINAYNNNVIVYCRASSNSNPGTGSQTRMAFMAYVNDASSPTNVEFQYYRSMSSHSATAMGDEVYVYKLTNASGGTWSVTTRKASIKEIAVASGSKLGVSWSSDKVTLSNTMTADDMPMSSSDATTAKSAIDTINTKLGSTTMGTTATTVTGAIAEHENDISTLNSKFTTTTATITPESTTTLNNTNCKKSGNIVSFVFDMTITITSSSWNVVASIPSNYAPSANVYFVLADTDNTNTIYRGMITTDGNIYIWGAVTSKQLRGSTSWAK